MLVDSYWRQLTLKVGFQLWGPNKVVFDVSISDSKVWRTENQFSLLDGYIGGDEITLIDMMIILMVFMMMIVSHNL